MNGDLVPARRIMVPLLGAALALTLVWGFSSNPRTFASNSGVAQQEVAAVVSAPLKPDWVEALLDARASGLRATLEARDIATQRKPLIPTLAPGSAVLKPDWVEALLAARASALRALLEARDILAAQ